MGKTSLSLQATQKKFEENNIPTIGLESFYFNIRINNEIIKLEISNSSGEEWFRSLIKNNLYPISSLAILMYSIEE